MSSVSVPKERQFQLLYLETLYLPFKEKSGDKWEEEPFWKAVEVFKVKAKEIGYDNPLERLRELGRDSYEQIRDRLKAGPPAYQLEGWRSPFIGQKLDVLAVLGAIHHMGGAKYEGKERIVLLDFWATWCKPCVQLASELSDISEKQKGRVAVIGVNNEGIFGSRGVGGMEKVKEFFKGHEEEFRYSMYVDVDQYARNNVYSKVEFPPIPCVVLVVDSEVRYAGNSSQVDKFLNEALEAIYPKE